LRNYWISWYHEQHMSSGDMDFPHWCTGLRVHDDANTMVAAVQANNENAAKEIIYQAYTTRPNNIEWRFCDEFPRNESPYSERFPQAAWMKWDIKDE